jgi:hypothetical protein
VKSAVFYGGPSFFCLMHTRFRKFTPLPLPHSLARRFH